MSSAEGVSCGKSLVEATEESKLVYRKRVVIAMTAMRSRRGGGGLQKGRVSMMKVFKYEESARLLLLSLCLVCAVLCEGRRRCQGLDIEAKYVGMTHGPDLGRCTVRLW